MYDAIIVGAGPGGASASYYLARQGARVLLLDKSTFPRDKTCGDGLSPRAIAVLDDMGLLEAVARKACRVSSIGIYSPNGNHFPAQVPKRGELVDYALVLPRLILDHLIVERAAAAGADFRAPVHVSDVAPNGSGVVVRGETGNGKFEEQGRCVLIATGANTKLLLRAGLLDEPPLTMLAARAYFENVGKSDVELQFRFDGVPLPGYGWVFPVSDTGANIGAGFYRVGRAAPTMPRTAQIAFEAFARGTLGNLLISARQVGPLKGFPLRVDFLKARLHRDRIFAVGEAAGLVNPLTGEGIDYALESGQLAARYLARALDQRGFDAEMCAGYTRQLHRRFRAQFRFLIYVARILINRPMLNRAVKAGLVNPSYKEFLIDIALGNLRASPISSVYMLARLALSSMIWS